MPLYDCSNSYPNSDSYFYTSRDRDIPYIRTSGELDMLLSAIGHNIPAPWNTVPSYPILHVDAHVSSYLNQLDMWLLKPEHVLQTGQTRMTDVSDTSLSNPYLPVDTYVSSSICTYRDCPTMHSSFFVTGNKELCKLRIVGTTVRLKNLPVGVIYSEGLME